MKKLVAIISIISMFSFTFAASGNLLASNDITRSIIIINILINIDIIIFFISNLSLIN